MQDGIGNRAYYMSFMHHYNVMALHIRKFRLPKNTRRLYIMVAICSVCLIFPSNVGSHKNIILTSIWTYFKLPTSLFPFAITTVPSIKIAWWNTSYHICDEVKTNFKQILAAYSRRSSICSEDIFVAYMFPHCGMFVILLLTDWHLI